MQTVRVKHLVTLRSPKTAVLLQDCQPDSGRAFFLMPMGFRCAIDVSMLFCANSVSCGALCSDRKANITQR